MYDAAGLMVSSRPEVEWDETEVGWFKALQEWRDEDVCPSCGWPKAICQDPRLSVGGVTIPAPTRCHITTAMAAAQTAYEKAPGANPHGLLWRAEVKGAAPPE